MEEKERKYPKPNDISDKVEIKYHYHKNRDGKGAPLINNVQVFLSDEMNKRLEEACETHNAPANVIVNSALEEFFTKLEK